MDLALIQAHHGVEDAVLRHLPFWRNAARRVYVTTTIGAPLQGVDVEQVAFGSGGHHGDELARRIVEMLEWALRQSWQTFGLFEYDAILLGHLAPPLEGMSAIRFRQDRPNYWKGAFFLHYPHVFSRPALSNIVPVLREILERGEVDTRYSDRFIGRAAELAKVPVQDLWVEKLGFSRDTIHPVEFPALDSAVRRGAVAFHGVKTQQCLDTLLRAHASRSK